MDNVQLKREYTYWWLFVGVLAIVAEFFWSTPLMWNITFVTLLVIEMVAVFRKKPGDTLSENIWAFQTGWSRALLVVGITGWICFRFAQLGGGVPDVGRWVLAGGLFAWLVIHWVWKGKYG